MTPRDILLLVLFNLIWGTGPIALKLGFGEMPPLLLMTLRFGLVALVLARFLRWHEGQMVQVIAIGLTGGALGFAFLSAGIARAGDIGPVGIATQLNVPFATLLSIVFLGEVVRWRRWLGLSLSLAGGVIVAFDPQVMSYLGAFGLVTCCAFFNAASMILMRGVKGIGPLELQAWIALVSWPVLLVLSLIFENGQGAAVQSAGFAPWAAIVYTALGLNLIAHAGFFAMLQRYEVSRVSPFLLLAPFFTVLFGVLVLGDHLTWRMLIGGLITLIGVGIITLRDRRVAEEHLGP